MRCFLTALLALTLLGGCSSTPSGSAGASPTTMTNDQILAIGREAAQCMREHGIPDFPDPIIDQHGQLQLPQGGAGDHAKEEMDNNPDAQRVCLPILDRLPPNVAGRSQGPGQFSQEDLANLLKFAQCMRRNGIPEWPDPKADGSFPISGTPLSSEGKSARIRAGFQACKQYWDKGIVGS
jgi:hypothetical protein